MLLKWTKIIHIKTLSSAFSNYNCNRSLIFYFCPIQIAENTTVLSVALINCYHPLQNTTINHFTATTACIVSQLNSRSLYTHSGMLSEICDTHTHTHTYAHTYTTMFLLIWTSPVLYALVNVLMWTILRLNKIYTYNKIMFQY